MLGCIFRPDLLNFLIICVTIKHIESSRNKRRKGIENSFFDLRAFAVKDLEVPQI